MIYGSDRDCEILEEVRVISPATVANVVCGFDCLGFALEAPYDEMVLRKCSSPGITITHTDGYGLTTDPAENVAGVALQAFIDSTQLEHGFELEINKGIRPGSGIGSSAASACGAVFAANKLTGCQLSNAELVDLATAGEMAASGSRHADNLAPCIFGGFTLVRSSDPLDIVSLDLPDLYATIIHPQIEIKTSEARAILPKDVPLSSAVRNWSNLGAFVAGLSRSDYDLMARAMSDEIVEPARKSLIPYFEEVKRACLDAGAMGGGISGSGPSIFILSKSRSLAVLVEAAMRDIYSGTGIIFKTYVSRISPYGVRAI